MKRSDVTQALLTAATIYWAKKGYSVHREVGIAAWGKRKADLFAFTYQLDTVICEIKSSAADFDSDAKWTSYLSGCHGFYFVVHFSYWNSAAADRLRVAAAKHGAGVLVLMESGRIESKLKLRIRRDQLPPGFIKSMITRIAFRNGNHKYNTRKQKIFVE